MWQTHMQNEWYIEPVSWGSPSMEEESACSSHCPTGLEVTTTHHNAWETCTSARGSKEAKETQVIMDTGDGSLETVILSLLQPPEKGMHPRILCHRLWPQCPCLSPWGSWSQSHQNRVEREFALQEEPGSNLSYSHVTSFYLTVLDAT